MMKGEHRYFPYFFKTAKLTLFVKRRDKMSVIYHPLSNFDKTSLSFWLSEIKIGFSQLNPQPQRGDDE